MATKIRETEWKYEAPTGATIPDLTRVPQVARVTAPEQQTLKAAYHDTEDLRLIRAGIPLRRRSGGDDAGWHLKLPDGEGSRIEIQLPLSSEVPEELPALVHAWTRGREVRPVAQITTKRERRLLQDQSGGTLAEVVVDDVTAESLGDTTTVSRWNEVEIELVAGGPKLLVAADEQLRRTGLVRSLRTAKLERALADRLPSSGGDKGRKAAAGSAGDVVLAYVRKHVGEMLAGDPRVRQDLPDSVHKMRVATRRLRSTLKTFRRYFDPQEADRLQEELKWIGGLLGAARDEEVMCEHLVADLSRLPRELTVGPVQARVVGHFAPRQAATRAEVLATLDGDRYYALLDSLDALLDAPPTTPAAGRSAAKKLPKIVDTSVRRVDRRMGDALALAPDDPRREVALHQARKAAKRARYAAEALKPVARKQSRRTVTTMKKLQTVLGDHQDAVIVGHTVRELGMLAHQSGENAFTYGVLYERNAATKPRLQAEAVQFWQRRR